MSKSPETRPQKAEIYPRGQRKWGKAGAPAANRKILVVIKKRNSTRQGHAVFFWAEKGDERSSLWRIQSICCLLQRQKLGHMH